METSTTPTESTVYAMLQCFKCAFDIAIISRICSCMAPNMEAWRAEWDKADIELAAASAQRVHGSLHLSREPRAMGCELWAALFDSLPETQVDSPEVVDVCSTEEDVETTASEAEVEVEQLLREAVGLVQGEALHPGAPRIFYRQVEALSRLEALCKVYQPHHLGIYSRELNTSGCRNYFVDTCAGFAHAAASRGVPRYFYEVLLEKRPCWLYFDLEFCRAPWILAILIHLEPGGLGAESRLPACLGHPSLLEPPESLLQHLCSTLRSP